MRFVQEELWGNWVKRGGGGGQWLISARAVTKAAVLLLLLPLKVRHNNGRILWVCQKQQCVSHLGILIKDPNAGEISDECLTKEGGENVRERVNRR